MSELWAHQQQAAAWAEPRRASMLAMEMGTGKSLVALELLHRWDARIALVICPKSVVQVWPSEVAKHVPHRWRVAALDTGPVRDRVDTMNRAIVTAQRLGKSCMIVVNYEAILREPMRSELRRRWPCLILDESHRIKMPAGKASRLCSQIADRAARRLLLTGTPMPHSPVDLYAQFRALDKNVFGTSAAAFRNRYTVQGPFGPSQIVSYKNLGELEHRFHDNAYRCRAADVLDLPPRTEVVRHHDLSDDGRRAYAGMETMLRTMLDEGLLTASNSLVQLLRLQQITCGCVPTDNGDPVRVDCTKGKLLAEVLTDCAPERWDQRPEPVVVFARFRADLDLIREIGNAQGRKCGEVSGKQNDLAAWQAGDLDLLAVQVQAGGLGIDLTRARYAIHYSMNWSLGDHDQCQARLHRPGQTRPVTFIKLVAQGTIETTMAEALAKRRNLIESVVDRLKKGGADNG